MEELTPAQLAAEIEKCDFCSEKPCREACPAHCSPADFIMSARIDNRFDVKRAALEILRQNPLGGICGAVCPESHCMAACVRKTFDQPVDIPIVQYSLIQRAGNLDALPERIQRDGPTGKNIAVLGAGPAGLGAAITLAQRGHDVEIFERTDKPGGACNLIPEHRLPPEILQQDLRHILSSDRIKLHCNKNIESDTDLSRFDAVIMSVGLTMPIKLNVEGEDLALFGWDYLEQPSKYPLSGAVAVVGGGAVACDCAVTARRNGAKRVEIIALEKLNEMPLAKRERDDLMTHGIHVNGRTKVSRIVTDNDRVKGLDLVHVVYENEEKVFKEDRSTSQNFDFTAITDVPNTEQHRADFDHVIIAIGHRPTLKKRSGWFIAGDCESGPSTVVEAVAAGKNAAAEVHAFLTDGDAVSVSNKLKSTVSVAGYQDRPVSLETSFFGRKILSPFILSAAPPTDGYEQMKRAFDAGWAGGIMKTAFDGLPIHIPSEYMFSFGDRTWGNCDNVSGHSLERVCAEIKQLVGEYPDRLVMASTGGPVTGDEVEDAAVWRSNTAKLEAAGVHGIEYSLSCPQGGDGTEGDIVSQSADLTAKIIGWILETSKPDVPKLFKLTAAVTSIEVIAKAIKAVFDRYPQAKAGVTLANTFPSVGFRQRANSKWDEGVVVGLSGEGVIPISNLTLAKVSSIGLAVSGNGGPMDYKSAADFLALGAETVQFCTIAMKYGYEIIDELNSGLSHLLSERKIESVRDLIGIALPEPITDFMDLTAKKKISDRNAALCVKCGNCTRCSYFAVSLDENRIPQTDPVRCVGCSICAKKCISGALFMRERSKEELEQLVED